MPKRDVIVIGASAGGVEALGRLIGDMPEDLPAALFVVIHLPDGASSALARILDRAGPLKAVVPEDGEEISPGRVYVARPDRHLLLEDGRVRLVRGPKENRHRPAVDALFRTAAVAKGPRVAGVVLTGARDDGTAGLRAIKRRGGVAVVQDPEEALFPGMPESALRYVDVDHCVGLGEMAPLLARLVREEIPFEKEGASPVPDDMDLEARVAGLDPSAINGDERPGQLSGFTCPDCSGPLYQVQDGKLVRFRCRVGHAYTAETMLDEKTGALEDALYVAMNTLDESALMADTLAARARDQGHERAAARFDQRARDARRHAEIIRQVLGDGATETTA